MVAHRAETVDGDELLYVIAAYQHQSGGGCEGVVGTLMSNLGLELALEELGIGFTRAKVGDRYVIETMRQKGWALGGESSGHIICSNVTTTGDGIISALQVLMALSTIGAPLHEVKKGMGKTPQTMINVRMRNKAAFEHNNEIEAAVASVESRLAGKGRVLLRPSGTEPVVRGLVEGQDKQQVKELAQEVAAVVGSTLGDGCAARHRSMSPRQQKQPASDKRRALRRK